MSLKAGTAKEGGVGVKIAEGVFGKKGAIKTAMQDVNKELGTYKPDIFVSLEVNSGGQYDDKIDLFGSVSREQTAPGVYNGPVQNWGSASRVDDFFNRLGAYEDLSEDDMDIDTSTTPILMPDGAIDAVIGIQIYYVAYWTGKYTNKNGEEKMGYNNFWYVVPVEADSEEEMNDAFQKIYSKLQSDEYAYGQLTKGRDYADKQKSDSTEFNYGANLNDPGDSDSLDDLPV